MSQLEATIEALKDLSSDAVGAVQHGVDSVASRLTSLVEPEPKPSRWPRLGWIAAAGVLVAIVVVVRRARSGSPVAPDAVAWNDLAEEAPLWAQPVRVDSA